MITRKKKAKLLNYLHNYERNLKENPDNDIFNIKRKTLEDIINLVTELLFEFNSTKINCDIYRFNYIKEQEINKNTITVLNDFKYKQEVLIEYFYRCNRAMDYINKNQNEDLSVDCYYKLKDIIEIDDIANILRGDKDEYKVI